MSDAEVAVQCRREGAVATVTLNRPESHNALTTEMKDELRAAMSDVASDSTVRAVVLTAAGRSFCVGQDLEEHAAALADGAEAAFDTVRTHYSPIVRLLRAMPKPVIAAVHGACVGAGLGLALACDHRVFAPDARLGTAFTGIGLTFDSGLSVTLPRAVGEARARGLMLFSRTFSAEDAIRWGISGEIDDEWAQRAEQIAGELAAGPTQAFAATKALLDEQVSWDAALAAEARAQTECGTTDDHQNAVRAFLAREVPQFVGR